MKMPYLITTCGLMDPMPIYRVSTKMNKYRVRFDVHYRFGDNRGVHEFNVPSGFAFDGASIPRAFWTAVGNPYSPAFSRSALLHDYLYSTGLVSRKRADEIFYRILRIDGVSWARAQTMYRAVRAAGWMFYKGGKK